MCSSNTQDYPPYEITAYDHKEDVDNDTHEDETIEERCSYCGRLFFHTTTCPNFDAAEDERTWQEDIGEFTRTSPFVGEPSPPKFDADEEC